MVAEQNEKLSKKLKRVDENIEVMAESVDTLIEIEAQRIKRG